MSEASTLSTVIPMTKPTVSHVTIDPATAQRWLGNNKVNRKLRIAKVNQYASDMRAGRWLLSNDAICFAADGTLLNGQHRLHAVIKSGTTIVLLVARNMPAEAMTSMDIGATRSASDALGWDGEKSTHLLAAVTKLCILYSDGRIYKSSKDQSVSPGEIREFIAANPLLRHSVTLTATVKSKIDAAPSVLGAVHWIIASKAGVAVADYYILQLASRTGEREGSAVLAVDSRLRQLRRNKSAFAQRSYLALLIKGWNHYARDKSVNALTMSASAKIPEPVRWQR